MRRIAPTRKVGPSKRTLARRLATKHQESTPPPRGLPPGKPGRVEHMRAHAMAYFTTGGPRDETGAFLWKMADLLAGGVKAPKNGAHSGNQNARKKKA